MLRSTLPASSDTATVPSDRLNSAPDRGWPDIASDFVKVVAPPDGLVSVRTYLSASWPSMNTCPLEATTTLCIVLSIS